MEFRAEIQAVLVVPYAKGKKLTTDTEYTEKRMQRIFATDGHG